MATKPEHTAMREGASPAIVGGSEKTPAGNGRIPSDLGTKIRRALAVLGPGLVTGASDDDPSGIATYSQVGAQFGYGMLWTMLLSYPLMAAIQEISARVGRVTGGGIAPTCAGIIRDGCFVVQSLWCLSPISTILGLISAPWVLPLNYYCREELGFIFYFSGSLRCSCRSWCPIQAM